MPVIQNGKNYDLCPIDWRLSVYNGGRIKGHLKPLKTVVLGVLGFMEAFNCGPFKFEPNGIPFGSRSKGKQTIT